VVTSFGLWLHEETILTSVYTAQQDKTSEDKDEGRKKKIKIQIQPVGNVSCIVVQWTAASSRDQEYVNHRRNAFSDKAACTKNAHQ